VYYGTASHTYNQAPGGGAYVTSPSYVTPTLPTGYTYYFAVTAIDSAGTESLYSNEATKVLP